MDHDTHQYKILGLGLALIVATALVLVSVHDDQSSGDGRALRVRDEPAAIVDVSPPVRTVSSVVSSQAVSNRTSLQEQR